MTTIELRLISVAAATAICQGQLPVDVQVAPGFPTEFSVAFANNVARIRRQGVVGIKVSRGGQLAS